MKISRNNWVMAGLLVATTVLSVVMVGLGKASWLEAFSFVTGAACVWLTVVESVWNFPISMINVVAFCVVFFRAKLLADGSLQVVYFVLSAIGWYLWLHGGERHTALKIARAKWLENVLVFAAVILLTAVLWPTLRALSGSATFWDALTTAISLGAQWLLNYKRLENWIYWIVADLIYIPLYLYKGLYLTSLLYVVFLVMATMGLLHWWALWKKQRAVPTVTRAGEPALAERAT